MPIFDDFAPDALTALQALTPIGLSLREPGELAGQWNGPMFALLGCDPAAGVPSTAQVLTLVHPEDRAGLAAVFEQARSGSAEIQYDYRVVLPDGSLRRLRASMRPVQIGQEDTPRMLAVMIDDTERHALGQQVAELREQLTLSTELGRIAVWHHDLLAGRVFCNPLGWELLGLPTRPEGISLEQARGRAHPEDLAQVQASFEQAMLTGRSDVQARYRHADGGWRHIHVRRSAQRNVHGELIGFVGVALDISARLAGEQALSLARDRATLAARGAGIATWEYDAATQTLFWDAQMYRLRGLPALEGTPAESTWRGAIHPEDLAEVEQRVLQARHHQGLIGHEFRVRWPDGSLRWLASRSSSLCDEQGRLLKRIGLNWDITEAKLHAEAQAQQQLAQRESLAKSEFLARMSHELRTPLNAVLGFTQLLQTPGGMADPAAAARKLAHIRSAGEHLLSLINDVLDLSRLESGDMRVDLVPVALAPLVASTLPLVEAQAQERQVRLVCGDLRGSLLADETRLRQVLLNLLSNGIKYNHIGGELRVETQRSATGALSLCVQDSGKGLSPAQIEHLFEPFNRLGREQEGIEGTGIGLAIVKALTERMGGEIRVQSWPGLGSRFELILPQAPAQPLAAPAAEAPVTDAAPADIRGRLLYIEDNPVNVLVVEELVARRPHLQLSCEGTGTRGLARARELQPDLILLDMQLPDFNGHEVLQRLRADPATAAIPCIALSANAMPEDITQALQAGFADYWTKPIDFRAFMQGLDSLFSARV